MVLLRGPAARDVATRTGLLKLFELPRLSQEILADVVSRNTIQDPPDERDTRLLLVGIASEREAEIQIDLSPIVTNEVDEEVASASWSNRSQPIRVATVTRVQRLSENVLSAGGVITEVEPVAGAA